MAKLVSTGSYNKDLSMVTGSIVSAIILVKVMEWWVTQSRKEFILFTKPCDNVKYHTGKSWKEIAGITAEDLKYGMSFVATKVTEKNTRLNVLADRRPEFDITGRLKNANHLILFTRKNGCTYYELNEPLAEKAIQLFASGDWKDYIGPELRESAPRKQLTEEEAEEISSFKAFIIPPHLEEDSDGE